LSNQVWSWFLALLGIAGMLFVGKKRWEAFLWLIMVEFFWIIFALQTKQFGFILGSVVYGIVYAKNAMKWRSEVLDD
jgi:hypothetical protein